MKSLLRPNEVAEMVGVEKSTIYQWTHTGFIPHVKVGKCLRFHEAKLLEWLEKRSVAGRTTRRVDVPTILGENR